MANRTNYPARQSISRRHNISMSSGCEHLISRGLKPPTRHRSSRRSPSFSGRAHPLPCKIIYQAPEDGPAFEDREFQLGDSEARIQDAHSPAPDATDPQPRSSDPQARQNPASRAQAQDLTIRALLMFLERSMSRHIAAQTEIARQQVYLAAMAVKQRVLFLHAIEASNGLHTTIQIPSAQNRTCVRGMSNERFCRSMC
jgi:hypothetical protein